MTLPKPIKRALKIASIPLIAYAALYITDPIFDMISPKIKSKSELARIIKEEAENKDLDPSKITGTLIQEPAGYAIRSKDGALEIVVGGFGATRRCVKHELTHEQYQDPTSYPETFTGELGYWLFREPRAILKSFF
jgi:hypothetical protein